MTLSPSHFLSKGSPRGYLAFVLHAHLPFVRHPEYDFFLEEDWFFEALSETYIPILLMLERLYNDHIPCRLTLSFSPTLIEMLANPLLKERYIRHLKHLCELCQKEIVRLKNDPHFLHLAHYYLDMYQRCLSVFQNQYQCDLLSGFKNFQECGFIDLITCGATHGFFPPMDSIPQTVHVQVSVACQTFQKYFGYRPNGLWIPECAYYPGHDAIFEKYGIKFFFVDSHGILKASEKPYYGTFAPLSCPQSNVLAFGRDIESSKQVWSADEGYPGDEWYREFYRDIGFDLPFDYIHPYITPDGVRKNTGLKYYRITGKDQNCLPYQPQMAHRRAWDHAGNFIFNREHQIDHLFKQMNRPPILTAPYDAELFGHWWFEGPLFLESVFRQVHLQKTFQIITHADYIDRFPHHQISEPSFSTWGDKGYASVWINSCNDWTYIHLHSMAKRMVQLAKQYPSSASDLVHRSLNQAARELLLAQCSDWSFIMTTNTMVPYAKKRFKEHVNRFNQIDKWLKDNTIDSRTLAIFESLDPVFSDIDYRIFATSA